MYLHSTEPSSPGPSSSSTGSVILGNLLCKIPTSANTTSRSSNTGAKSCWWGAKPPTTRSSRTSWPLTWRGSRSLLSMTCWRCRLLAGASDAWRHLLNGTTLITKFRVDCCKNTTILFCLFVSWYFCVDYKIIIISSLLL